MSFATLPNSLDNRQDKRLSLKMLIEKFSSTGWTVNAALTVYLMESKIHEKALHELNTPLNGINIKIFYLNSAVWFIVLLLIDSSEMRIRIWSDQNIKCANSAEFFKSKYMEYLITTKLQGIFLNWEIEKDERLIWGCVSNCYRNLEDYCSTSKLVMLNNIFYLLYLIIFSGLVMWMWR